MMLEKKRKEEIIKKILSPYNEEDEIDTTSPPKPSLLIRQISDPEYYLKKIVNNGFKFDILEFENIETKVVYICDKLKENLLKIIEINKIQVNERSQILLNEKSAIKNKIDKYNNQMKEIIEMVNTIII
jgi:hypothetical protein